MAKKVIFAVLAVLLVSGVVFAQDNSNIVVPYILKASKPITVDGNLDEWNFCFPIDFNQSSIPDSSRCYGWFPDDNDDLSGTIKMMYDDNYLYFSAHVRDDYPGYFSDAEWAADGIEIYLGNYDIGDALHAPAHAAVLLDSTNGDYEIQLNITFDAMLDSIRTILYGGGVNAPIGSDSTQIAYRVWDDEDGYDLEGKIYLDDLTSATTGNTFAFTEGTRIAATWSLFDVDTSGTPYASSGSFDGYQYTCNPLAPWQGGGPAWQYCDVMGLPFTSLITEVEENGHGFVPGSFTLEQNYPNPFNPSTNIRFSLNRPSKVTLGIYNVKGQLVKKVLNNEYRAAGSHLQNVDMSNLPSGVYIYVLQAGNKKLARKMMLLK